VSDIAAGRENDRMDLEQGAAGQLYPMELDQQISVRLSGDMIIVNRTLIKENEFDVPTGPRSQPGIAKPLAQFVRELNRQEGEKIILLIAQASGCGPDPGAAHITKF